jgi:hypothetical protein
MPAAILWALAAIGAATSAKWLLREARRINAELHPRPAEAVADPYPGPGTATLRRDAAGIYRPD